MLRIKILRNLLFLSLAIAVLLPAYEMLFIHPAYNHLLTAETEDEAVRYASYMVRTLGLENQFLTKDHLPEGFEEKLQPVKRDKRLIKLKIFSANGEIIFSSQADEIGEINSKDYFVAIVAKGQVYSKVVKKDRKTAEGIVTRLDVVETYVPFMAKDEFGGAIEVYYDVTENVDTIAAQVRRSVTISMVMSLAFLLAILFALNRAYVNLQEREAAEKALNLANEQLEMRVDERTRELTVANEQLTGQIAEKTLAQTALGQAIDDIRVDREKLDGILRSVPDGIIVADSELNVLHLNAAAERLLDKSLEDVLGQSIAILSDVVDFRGNIEAFIKAPHAPLPFEFETEDVAGQSSRAYQVRISQFLSDGTKSRGIILLIRDVTRERDVDRMKSAFLGMATHELNTPLTTIIGYTELLTAEETAGSFSDEQQKNYLQLIHDKALALGGLVDDLLDISRVESGRPLVLNYGQFSLDELIEKVAQTYRKANPIHEIEVALPDHPVDLFADPLRLDQALDHLIGNAVKYSPGGGHILVSLHCNETECELRVEDEGIGMNAEQLSHIFDRFYRADSTDSAVQGAGLGMSIVRNIVLAHHGEIKVDSEIAGGTTVILKLPLAPPVDSLEARYPYSS